jgi:hypothetical protein
MGMMDKMMPNMMEGMNSKGMGETMYEVVLRMMENCLTQMSEEQRRNI